MLYQLSYVRLGFSRYHRAGPLMAHRRDGRRRGDRRRYEQIGRAGCSHHPLGQQEVPALGFTQLRRCEEGQTMAEYAVVIGVITPILVLLFAAMGNAIVARLQTVAGFLT
jgi:Flp pilus assembly pilin Flp